MHSPRFHPRLLGLRHPPRDWSATTKTFLGLSALIVLLSPNQISLSYTESATLRLLQDQEQLYERENQRLTVKVSRLGYHGLVCTCVLWLSVPCSPDRLMAACVGSSGPDQANL